MDSNPAYTAPSGGTISPHDMAQEAHLAEEILSTGEHQLLWGDLAEAEESFRRAESILNEEDASLYFRQALSFFEFGSQEENDRALSLANKKFKQGYRLDPHCFELLTAWGNTLSLIGERQQEPHFFLEAKDRYEKALGLADDSAELFWDYAVAWYHIGDHSGEAVDLQKGLQAFERAIELSDTLSAEFWVDYGATALLLATKMHDHRLVVKAVNCFKRAVSEEDSSVESWNSLAEALEMLHAHTHEEDHFNQASECYAKAAKLSPQDPDIWLEWAQFLLNSAAKNGNIQRLRACLEKCHRAYACDGENAEILAAWGSALALLGKATERLDLIYEAENKLSQAIEIDEDSLSVWHSLGTCFLCFGAYYKDADYYYQAIEKFQTGLSIDRTCDELWLEMAKAYVSVAVLQEDLEHLNQSLKFFKKALHLAPSTSRHIEYASALSKLGEMSGDQHFLESAIYHFEVALAWQKNAIYHHPDWLFAYASTLDLLGDCLEDEKYYTQAIEIFSHVLMVDPEFPSLHHRLAQTLCHLGESMGEIDYFYRAIHHLRLCLKQEDENDQMILDWGIALIHIAHHTPVLTDVDPLMQEAEQKLTLSATLGNPQAYYQLGCLYSILQNFEKAMFFLKKAADFHALPPLEELLGDEWLEDLRSTSLFHEFLERNPHLSEDS